MIVIFVALTAEEQALLLAVEAKKKAWLAELKAHMEQDLEVKFLICIKNDNTFASSANGQFWSENG